MQPRYRRRTLENGIAAGLEKIAEALSEKKKKKKEEEAEEAPALKEAVGCQVRLGGDDGPFCCYSAGHKGPHSFGCPLSSYLIWQSCGGVFQSLAEVEDAILAKGRYWGQPAEEWIIQFYRAPDRKPVGEKAKQLVEADRARRRSAT